MRKKYFTSILKILAILVLLSIFVYISSIESIPENIVLFEGESLNLKIATGLSLDDYETELTASNINNKKISTTGSNNLQLNLFGNIKIKNVSVDVIPKTTVIPIGSSIGMKLYTKGVLVVGMSQIDTDNNTKEKPYENSGIEQGDTIIEVNNNEIGNTDELIEEVNNSNGEAISIKYVRNNQTMQTSITPVKSDNEYKIGLWVRDAAAGVRNINFL